MGDFYKGIEEINSDCIITDDIKKDYILGHNKDSSLIAYSNLVGDDEIIFHHNASNSSVCQNTKSVFCHYVIVVYSSS